MQAVFHCCCFSLFVSSSFFGASRTMFAAQIGGPWFAAEGLLHQWCSTRKLCGVVWRGVRAEGSLGWDNGNGHLRRKTVLSNIFRVHVTIPGCHGANTANTVWCVEDMLLQLFDGRSLMRRKVNETGSTCHPIFLGDPVTTLLSCFKDQPGEPTGRSG